MELQNKFEEIINNEVSPSYNYSYLEGVEEAAKECTILCLEEQLKLLQEYRNNLIDTIKNPYIIKDNIEHRLGRQLKILKDGNNE